MKFLRKRTLRPKGRKDGQIIPKITGYKIAGCYALPIDANNRTKWWVTNKEVINIIADSKDIDINVESLGMIGPFADFNEVTNYCKSIR